MAVAGVPRYNPHGPESAPTVGPQGGGAIRFLKSLHFRIASGVIATILLISALYIVVDYRSNRRQLIGELQDSADQLADVSLRGLLELAMVGEHPEMLQPALEKLAANTAVLHISLLDPGGTVRFSSNPAELGRHFGLEDEGCHNCHMDPSPELHHSVFFQQDGGQVLRNVSLVPNGPECHRCHDSARRNNGLLIVDFSTAGIGQRLSADLEETILRAGLTAFLILVVLGLLMNKLVIRRLECLTEAAARSTEAGDFSPLAEVSGADEIGRLARSFEEMNGRVQNSFQDLRRQQAYLQNLVNSLPDGLIVVDSQHRTEMTNRAAGGFWNRVQLKQMLAGTQQSAGVSRTLKKTFASGLSSTCEIRLDAHPGPQANSSRNTFRFIEIHCSPVRNTDGAVEKAILLVRDITQRKTLEAQAGRADRLASVGRLAAGLAHEINNPMAAITTCVEGLSRHVGRSEGIEASEKEEIRDYLFTVGEAALRCKEITQRLLSASVEQDAGEFERVDLWDVVHDAVTLVEHQAERQGVTISAPKPARPAGILGNRRKLSQLILNLLLNSLEALPDGGEILISLAHLNDFVQLQIADNGSGIPEEDLEHVFDPFFTTKTEGRGTGLGLSISQWIVRQHQGRIEVRSRPGEGAAFSILFPNYELKTA